MGLPNWLHWTAWFVKYFILLLISSVLIVFILKIKWSTTKHFNIFTYSNPFVLIFFFMGFICATITFCFAISVMFDKGNKSLQINLVYRFSRFCNVWIIFFSNSRLILGIKDQIEQAVTCILNFYQKSLLKCLDFSQYCSGCSRFSLVPFFCTFLFNQAKLR